MNAANAAALVQLTCRFRAQIHIDQGPRIINCKSMMGVLSIGASPIDSLTFSANGEDERAALDAIEALIRSWGA